METSASLSSQLCRHVVHQTLAAARPPAVNDTVCRCVLIDHLLLARFDSDIDNTQRRWVQHVNHGMSRSVRRSQTEEKRKGCDEFETVSTSSRTDVKSLPSVMPSALASGMLRVPRGLTVQKKKQAPGTCGYQGDRPS